MHAPVAAAAVRRSLASSRTRSPPFSKVTLRRTSTTGQIHKEHQHQHQKQQQQQTMSTHVEFGKVLWLPTPERIASTRMLAFTRLAGERSSRDLSSWPRLHEWSTSEIGLFWQTVSDFCDIKWLHRGDGPAYTPPPSEAVKGGEKREKGAGAGMRGARWFDGAKLNFAHNMLPPPSDEQVLVSVSESPELASRPLSGRELHALVARCVRGLRAAGIKKGDRVAGVMTNSQEALVFMLGTTAVGAIWSSCSPDFGVEGIVDRLGQLSPKLVLFSVGYLYGGRWHDCRILALDVLKRLPGSPMGISIPYWPAPDGEELYSHADLVSPSWDTLSPLLPYSQFLDDSARPLHTRRSSDGGGGGMWSHGGNGIGGGDGGAVDEGDIDFEPTDFDHPVFIMFSSGTTGLPKCMVHGAGGTLLQQKKELELHCDLQRGDRLMFFSTLGWMMWNWAAAALSVDGAGLVAFDGSPGYPHLDRLWRVAAREGVTHLGASPKYFGACREKGVVPRVDCAQDGGLQRLRTVLSTGSPLLPEHFQWIYQAVKTDIHLASISGGTDILGCFALGNPTRPVRAGHLQCIGLGMDVCAYRQDDEITPTGSVKQPGAMLSRVAPTGEMGELVCRRPFPSMPVFFWGDPDGTKYRSAYFEAFDGEEVWAHGDFVKITEEGGVVISGRSDAVLNPGGVRIGTAEIYRQVERVAEVEDSVAVGLRVGGDVQVVLFVKLAQPHTKNELSSDKNSSGPFSVDADVEQKIKTIIKANLTARHVPARILGIRDIPYTRSGKKVEVAVTKAVHGEPSNNLSALANPDCLEDFEKAGRFLRGLTVTSSGAEPITSRL